MAKKKRITAWLLCVIFLCGCLCPGMSVKAAVHKKFTLSQALSLGMAESSDYRKVKSKILLKEVKYKEAVKSIRLKKKNMSTFRWSPLLSFKFPEKATLSEEYEFIYKPLQIQSEISVLEHRLTDVKYEVYEEISNLYTEIYTYQEKITYKEERLENLKDSLARNQAKLMIGEAKQSDVDKINSSITKAESELASDMRAFEKGKSELSELTGLDVTSGYDFLNPYKDSRIARDDLEGLIQTTLDRSQSYYEAKMTTKLALTSVDTNYSLMKNQYGNKMGYISSYVIQAKNGQKLNNEAFKLAYDSFLTAIDAPWQGKIRILFIKIPREWFKGSIDGVRYVEDDPYLLYTNVLEYQEAVSDQESLKKEITDSVKEGFENLVTAKNSYDSLKEQTEQAKKDMEQAAVQNKAGELEFAEYEEVKTSYEELQMSEMEALELYTQLLYSYDRLTCGAVTELLESRAYGMSQGTQGESYVTEDTGTGKPYYYISALVEDNLFELGVQIPEDFETDATHFELWVDGMQIGDKTEIGKTIRHLMLDLDNADTVILRIYEDDKVLADCEIYPSEYQGELDFEGTQKKEQAGQEVVYGTYSISTNKKTGLVTFHIAPEEQYGITAFRLLDRQGKAIYSETPVKVEQGLTYLAILKEDLSNISIELYDEQDKLIAAGKLDTSAKKITEGEVSG